MLHLSTFTEDIVFDIAWNVKTVIIFDNNINSLINWLLCYDQQSFR